jgi:hypothetical protein
MKKAAILTVAVCVGALIAYAQSLVVQTEFQVSMAEDLSVTLVDAEPVVLGPVTLGASNDSIVGVRNGNMRATMQVRILDADAAGWTLAEVPGTDAYTVTVGPEDVEVPLSTDWQDVLDVYPYGEYMVEVHYYAPVEDTLGGGVAHNYVVQYRLVDAS